MTRSTLGILGLAFAPLGVVLLVFATATSSSMPPDPLADSGWLYINKSRRESHFHSAQDFEPETADDPAEAGPPDADVVAKQISAFKDRDPVVRELALRRLLPFPDRAGAAVAAAAVTGPLQTRLTAVELLQEWGAPTDGLDPWQPESTTAERRKAVTDWAARPDLKPPVANRPPTATEWDAVRDDLARLATAADGEQVAIRERLARRGPAVLPAIAAATAAAATDTGRERLLAVRYRIAATDALTLRWPGGLDRLAATRTGTRHEAVRELGRTATAADEPLLLELFADADPLVRELSLRILHAVSGKSATGGLVRLLADPDSNVRAAVLKQFAEKPARSILPTVAEYMDKETDPDLVVHAVRVFRAAGGIESVRHLSPLLKHASWRVRADAVEAIGECGSNFRSEPKEKEEVNSLLRGALADEEGFVVGRAIGALKKSHDAASIKPMVDAAVKHPELAGEVIVALDYSSDLRAQALPHLRAFCRHPDPAVRAKAVTAACFPDSDDAAADVKAGLADPSAVVRQAAAAVAFKVLDADRRKQLENIAADGADAVVAVVRGGKGRPAGYAGLPGVLESRLKAPTPAERVEAALTLVALGRDDVVPVLLTAGKSEPATLSRIVHAIPWLPWDKRADLFRAVTAGRPTEGLIEEAVDALAESSDPRAGPLIWDLAAGPETPLPAAGPIVSALQGIADPKRRRSFGGRGDSEPTPEQQKLAEAAKEKVNTGGPAQRLVALVLLAKLDPPGAAAAAEMLVADPTAAALHRSARQIQLVALPKADATRIAVATLRDSDPGARRIAVLFLTIGTDPLRQVAAGVYLDRDYSGRALESSDGSEYIPTVHRGLDAATLRGLLKDPDPVTAAGAGYLLALLGDSAGLPSLVRHWREAARDDWEWGRLVVSAVACIEDDAHVGVVEEVYRSLLSDDGDPKDRSAVKALYWIVRPMGGPNALKLRKTIRREVGMPALDG